jgi:hypothetical protein
MVKKEDPILLFRFPGTNFFEEKQENIFFGRETETEELLHAIKAHDVYVIFANSGIGKTSLLNARLIPKLKTEQFLPIRFRFQDPKISPLAEITQKLEPYLPKGYTFSPERRLWELFKSCDFGKKKVLFIFDQFEEFFNHTKPEKDSCAGQLSDLICGYLPDYVSQEMRQKFRASDPTDAELQYYSPPDVKFLFLIRADKLNLLDSLSNEIPLILRNRFHLKPLSENQAKDAILKPAALPQNGFATPPLHLEQVSQHICDYLKNEDGEVESFQLQILCRELEKRKIKQYLKHPSEASLTITEEELGGDAGMSNIIQNYYVNQLELIADVELRKKATLLIEDELIIDNRRISMPEKFLTNKGYPEELLNYLVDNTRLIRGDRPNKERYFEISHDKLLAPILKSRQSRLEIDANRKRIQELEEAKATEERRSRELQQQKEKEEEDNRQLRRQQLADKKRNEELLQLKDDVEKKARRLKRVTVGIALLLAASLFELIYANQQRVQTKIGNVQNWIAKEDFASAANSLGFHRINRIFYIGYLDTLQKLSDYIEQQKSQKEQFIKHMSQGDSLMKKRGIYLLAAYNQYQFAKLAGYHQQDNQLNQKTEDLQKKINDEFRLAVEKMNAFERAGGEDDAQREYLLVTALSERVILTEADADYYYGLLQTFKTAHHLK